MNVANLYIRVSTDEQAEKGYSQRDQEERLKKFCEINKITIRQVIFEDHSAKTFDRPEWKKMLLDLKKNKRKSDILLFTKWDRFSRNAGDAYQMISLLRSLGVEPQAIEQPLDLSVPENKMMLAFYLAAPEVENDRRALNTTNGMRRARKEGRWMGPAPAGYKNWLNEHGKKSIELKEPDASLMKWAFEELAKGVYNTQQIHLKVREKGLDICKAYFWKCIKNPVYCGRIVVPEYEGEEEYTVKGQHEAIISESTFNKVQDILDKRKRKKYRTKIVTREEYPLRGFLLCPICSKPLTASKSKGYSQHYAYYHCKLQCRQRFNTEIVHQKFEQELEKYEPRADIIGLYTTILQELYTQRTKGNFTEKAEIERRIRTLEDNTSKARDLLIRGDIDPQDFKELKLKYTSEISELEERQQALKNARGSMDSFRTESISKFKNMASIYRKCNIEQKRKLISSIFPENLTFSGTSFRTARVNHFLHYIYLINNELNPKKKQTKLDFKELSAKVPRSRFELPRPCERHPLKMVRLPISPPGLIFTFGITKIKIFRSFTSRKSLFTALFY